MDMASSKWTDVVSGVPHMSVLEPLLFVVYFNDLPVKTVNVTKHFAEVSKIISVIKEKLDFVKLIRCMGMVHNLGYKVMHFKKSNPKEVLTI